MTKPRKQLISSETTPYYHCVSRCVRRSFLCGTDEQGRNFEHRRAWIENRLHFLAAIFAIELCAYAVMSNHYHTVLFINKTEADNWSEQEVARRWHQLFKGNLLSQRYLQGEVLTSPEAEALSTCLLQWRHRLMDISWFLRLVNETIAREANAEDHCTGRFWEGRFKSQALLDEKALLACMAYVDLNPIRAGMAKTPDTSDFTSAKARIEKAKRAPNPNHQRQQPKTLRSFAGNPRLDMPDGMPFRLTDYLELLDWTGKIARPDKKGAIPKDLPPLLEHLNMDPKHWLYCSTQFESRFKGFVGAAHKIKQACQALGYQRCSGLAHAKLLN